jgi:Rha family phage regulatory protein
MHLVEISNGIPATTSLAIAQKFGKRHDDVLKAIRNLMAQMPDGGVRNFAEVIATFKNGKGGTQTAPAYCIDRDGFTLLAMGFTGKKALQFKLDYIAAFNQMEKALLSQTLNHQSAYWQQKRVEGKQVRLAWGGCVQEFVAYAKAQGSQSAEKYYMAITKMEYSALELVKQAADKHFRDRLNAIEHGQLTVVEMAAQRALREGMDNGLHYKAIYQLCKQACVDLAASLRKYLPAANDAYLQLRKGGAA